MLLAFVWLIPIEFTACDKDSKWCSFAYWITESAGKYGTLGIIVLTSIFYSVRFSTNAERFKNFLKSFIALTVFLSVFAFFNEHVTKKALKLPRPSHIYIFDHAFSSLKVDSLYTFDVEGRQKLLRELIEGHKESFVKIDKKVIEHWIEEAGYSFPSGHSFNAFLMACILAFSLYHSKRAVVKNLYILPLTWSLFVAVSRVAIGAHSALDVSFGAGMGIIVALLFLYFDNTRKLILHKKLEEA